MGNHETYYYLKSTGCVGNGIGKDEEYFFRKSAGNVFDSFHSAHQETMKRWVKGKMKKYGGRPYDFDKENYTYTLTDERRMVISKRIGCVPYALYFDSYEEAEKAKEVLIGFTKSEEGLINLVFGVKE